MVRYGQFLQTLKLSEKRVAKVVPDRIMALAVHPSPALPIVAVGDKWGRLGIWQVVRVFLVDINMLWYDVVGMFVCCSFRVMVRMVFICLSRTVSRCRV